MLFHVTITHHQQDCPGRKTDMLPVLVGASEQRDAIGAECGVACHLVLWGGPCILWAEPEHIAYALLEAPDLEAVMCYVQRVVPSEWTARALPVFSLPGQLPILRTLLSTPAPPFGPPAEVQPIEPSATVDTSGVTRLVESPAIPSVSALDEPTSDTPTPRQPGSITEILEGLDASRGKATDHETRQEVSATPTSGEKTTVILGRDDQQAPTLRLQVIAGPSQSSVFEVGTAGGTLGRLPENLIHLADGRLSRQHARIEYRDASFWITDLGSQNGTVVNGRRVTEPHRLQVGDTVEVGTSRLAVIPESELG